MSEIQVLREFKDNLVDFFRDLIDQLPKEEDLVFLRIFLVNQMNIKDMIDIFNHNINKDNQLLRTMVKQRNEAFFIDNDPFGLSQNLKMKANRFKEIWSSPLLGDEDKVVLWNWVDSFIRLGDKYTKIVSARSIE